KNFLILEQSKPLTLVTLDILHFRHFGCGYAALGCLTGKLIIVSIPLNAPWYYQGQGTVGRAFKIHF
ncbi:MAG: hypothetical protein NUV74_07915, partial [Candidatus Brocadiaceae bacterium]|nr:hypothetical protein [Candidatus Brocadiaceae bacterium]